MSFHLGAAGATIDVAREVSPVAVAKAEAEANRVVWENRDVAIRFVDAAEAARLPLRKEPARTGMLRLIDVADFDLSACGGTHVATTGVVGVIAVTGWERFKGGSRIGFVCGGRALAAHGRLRDVTTAIGQRLSVGLDELEAAVARVQDEARDKGRELKRLHEELSGYRAASLAEAAEPAGAFRAVLRHQPGGDAGSLKGLATAVAARPGLVVALVGDGQPAPVVLARSADVMVDAAMVIRALSAEFGGRGGGRPELAQGGIQATPDVILDRVRVRLTTGDV